MPIFEYIGIDSKGKRSAGTVDAENERAARSKLRRMGVFPTTVGIEGQSGKKVGFGMQIDLSKYLKRVRIQDIAIMTRQLSTLVGANIPLVESLGALVEQVENPKLKAILARVREKVTEGSRLSDALRGNPRVFNDVFVNMVSAGETSGALEAVLARLADFTEGQHKLRSKVVGAMVYPIIMAVVGSVLTIFLLTNVVPQVAQMIEESGKALPIPTRFLMWVSHSLVDYWYVFFLLIPLVIYGVRKFLSSPKGRAWWDKKLLKLPLFGKLARMVIIARFSRTLATLLSSGVPLLTAMDIVRNIITNTRLREVVEQSRDNIREGQSIADPLKRSGEFPPMVTHMIAVGERTGELEKMLERVADTYDGEVENTVSAMTTVLEPLMILVMAGIVGFIVISIMLPMLQLQQV